MAKITVAGQAVVVTSSLKYDDIKLIAKYRPDALTLYSEDEEKEPVFKIGLTDGVGTIGTYGAEFSQPAADGSASLTLIYEGETDDLKESIVDSIGGALLKLNKLERKLPAVVAEIASEKAEILSNISVVQ